MHNSSQSQEEHKAKKNHLINRILELECKQPFEKEIEHERQLNSVILPLEELNTAVSSSNADSPSPQPLEHISIPDDKMDFVCKSPLDDLKPFQLPSRAMTIANSDLYDPLTYVSHSSKLNPENSFLSSKLSSREVSPGPPHIRTIKRKASLSDDHPVLLKKHLKVPPSSPHIQPSSPLLSPIRWNTMPPHSRVPNPSPVPITLQSKRPRSTSASSVSSVASLKSLTHTSIPLHVQNAFYTHQKPTQQSIEGNSSKSAHPGQSLNLSLAQEEMSKMSL